MSARRLFKFILYAVLLASPRMAHAQVAESCECPKLSCNTECEVEQSISFYSEKCGDGSRVRSCAKPACVKIENPPAHCVAAAAPSASAPAVAVSSSANDVAQRQVASVVEREVIGRVKFLEGQASKIVEGRKKISLGVGDEVRDKDRLVTEDTGKVQILFNSGNTLNITPNSEVVIADAADSYAKPDKKRMVLDLIKGRVRSKVIQKYEGNNQSHYRVRTAAAVAGVRGTEFTVSVYDEANMFVSRIETLEGVVELSGHDLEKPARVGKLEGATYVASRESLVTAEDRSKFASKGYLTPVYKLSTAQLETLEKETRFAELGERAKTSRQPSSSGGADDDAICTSPSGSLNHCAWTCENNPSGEKRCRTDLPSVSCVRRICNANGAWSQPTRLPASFHESCEPNRTVVKPCDY